MEAFINVKMFSTKRFIFIEIKHIFICRGLNFVRGFVFRTDYSVRLINLVIGCRSVWRQQTLLEKNSRNQLNNNYVIRENQLLVFRAT